MKPWHKRLGKSLSPKPLLSRAFGNLEVSAPSLSGFLRYHSQASELGPNDFVETIYRQIRVTSPPYKQSYCELIRRAPDATLNHLENEKIPIHTALIEQCVIHGHIKAPIDLRRGLAVGFEFPHGKLPWGDVYPQPLKWSRRLKGDAIFIPNFTNIFHLLVEYILPAFCAIIRNPKLFQRDIYFVSQAKYPIIEYLAQFLELKGFRAHVIYTTPIDQIFVDRLILSRARARDSAFNYAYFEEIEEVFDFFDSIIKDVNVSERVFIKRSNTPRRNLLNQEEIVTQLHSLNYDNVEFNFDNCLQQIAIFRKSRLIISPHGAALTNISFSNASSIFEIFSVDCRPTCFINMASQHKLNYGYMLGSKEIGNGHFSVNVSELKRHLREI